MNATQLAILASINAEVARMEAMKCANIQAYLAKEPQPYKADDLFYIAAELDRLRMEAVNT